MMGSERQTEATGPAGIRWSHRQLPYAAGLDGLRALAVLAVIFYHAGTSWLRGGFLGVEIFFVISGYLITSLLLGEWEARGSISLKAFWLRRARRLLPAVFTLLIVTLAYAVLFLPDQVASLRKDVLAATFYVSNWYLILDHKSYFEAIGRPSLLRHLWSLAVEEQFYVFWPLFLTLALRRLRRPFVLVATAAIALASTALMAFLYVPGADPSLVYYGTDTRATGLLIGATLAFLWRPWQAGRQSRSVGPLALDAAGVLALLGLFGFCVGLGEYDPFLYQGGLALVALLTALAIATVVHPDGHLGPLFLGRQPWRWIGLRSYSIYLWHWPVFTVTRPQLDLPLDGLPLLVLRLAATALLAELSYRLVETPIRGGALGRGWRRLSEASGTQRRRLALRYGGSAAALVLVIITLGATAAQAQPPTAPADLAIGSINTIGSGGSQQASSQAPIGSESAPTPAPQASAEAPAAAIDLAESASLSTATSVPEPTAAPQVAGVSTAEPQPTVTPQPNPTAAPRPAPAVGRAGMATLIGDSVVLSAWAAVHAVPGLEVDGKVNRQASEAIEIMRQDASEGWLGSTVIVHIGDNGPFSAKEFDEMMQVLGSQRRVIFMTVRVPREWETSNNEVITEGVKRYSNAELLDWRAASAGHPGWFRDDGVHTSGDGAKAYASLIASAIGQSASR